jgi:hypothetical protein
MQALRDPIVIGRLNWSGFKKAKNKPNLYYRNLPLSKLPNDSINVSYYYYIDGKRKQVNDKMYDHLISEISARVEREEYTRAFNNANGYTDSYFAGFSNNYARLA